MSAPALDDDFLGEAIEDVAVEQLISERGIEVLAAAGVPWAARLDVGGSCADGGGPFPHPLRHEPGANFGSDVAEHASQDELI